MVLFLLLPRQKTLLHLESHEVSSVLSLAGIYVLRTPLPTPISSPCSSKSRPGPQLPGASLPRLRQGGGLDIFTFPK